MGVDVGSHKIDSASSPSVIALCFKCCKTLIGAWKYVISQFFILSPVLLKPGGGEQGQRQEAPLCLNFVFMWDPITHSTKLFQKLPIKGL